MFGILLQFILLVQGIPVLPNQGGTVTGLLTSEAARPAPGVRVAVMIQPENLSDVANAAALVSIAETDESGRFRLENIPPGRYYITAGRVELPTYYPGTLEIGSGRIVTIGSGATISGLDFSIKDVSDRGVETIHTVLRIPIQLNLEDGLRIPVFSEHGKVRLRLTHIADGAITETPLDASTLTLPVATGEYKAGIENLPDGYEVTSLTYGSINLMNDSLKVTLDDLPKPAANEQMFFTSTQTGIVLQRRTPVTAPSLQDQGAYLQSSSQVFVLGSIVSKTELMLSLSKKGVVPLRSTGVAVRGRVENAGQEEVYISGAPGTLYADGTFEFRGVPPGRHDVVMLGGSSTSRQFVAVALVGGSDVENLQPQDTIALPLDVMSAVAISAGLAPNAFIANLHSIRGHVVEASTHHPVAGIVTLRGYGGRSATFSLPADGEFEIPNLLPGSYGLQIETFESSRLIRTVVIENDDLELNLSVP